MVRSLAFLLREFAVNVSRISARLRRLDWRGAATLAAVKIIDYSDHLPRRIRPPLAVRTRASGSDYGALQAAVRRDLPADDNTAGLILSCATATLSYLASANQPEQHLHITTVRRSNDGCFHIRYFDYEGWIWRLAPCRAPNFTVASITLSPGFEIVNARYLRMAVERTAVFEKQESFAYGTAVLAAADPLSHVDPRDATVLAELDQQSYRIGCRFGGAKGRGSLLAPLLLYSQRRIVRAIWLELVAQIGMFYRSSEVAGSEDARRRSHAPRSKVTKLPYRHGMVLCVRTFALENDEKQ